MIAASARLVLSLDRSVALALWEPPRASRGILVAPLVRRVLVSAGRRAVDVPEGAAWGGVFDPEGEPPLLLGAFRVLGGAQELRIAVDRWAGAALRGDGVLAPLGPNEFERALREIEAAGLRLPESEPYGPPLPLWWARAGPVPVPPRPRGAAAGAGERPPEVPEALRFVVEDPEYGGRLAPDVLARYPSVIEVPTERIVAHAPGAKRHPERRNIPAPTRWVIATAPDGSRLVILALRDPISGADRVVHAAVAPPGGAPAGTDAMAFELYYPGAGEELARVLSGGNNSAVITTAPAGGEEGRGQWTLDRWLGGGGG